MEVVNEIVLGSPSERAVQEVRYLQQLNGVRYEVSRTLGYDEPLLLEMFLLPDFHVMIEGHYALFYGVERWIAADESRAPRLLNHLIEHQELKQATRLIVFGKWKSKYRIIAESPPGSVYRSLEDLAIVKELLGSSLRARDPLDWAGLSIPLIQHFSECGVFSISDWAKMLMIAVFHHPDHNRVDQISAIISERLPNEKARKAISSEICLVLQSEKDLELNVQSLARVITLSPDELFTLCFTNFRDRQTLQGSALQSIIHYRVELLRLIVDDVTELSWDNCQVLMANHGMLKPNRYAKLFSCIPKHLIQYASIYHRDHDSINRSSAYASPNPLSMDSWFAFRVAGMYYYLSPGVVIQSDPKGDRIMSSHWQTDRVDYAIEPEWINCGHLFQEQRCVLMPQLLLNFIVTSSQSLAKSARFDDAI